MSAARGACGMNFEAPEMRCPKCWCVIPANGEFIEDAAGEIINDSNGFPKVRKTGLLGCANCAIAALPPKPKEQKRRRRPGAAEGQEELNVPSIFVN